MLTGRCLCGGVRFTIRGPHSGVGFCHCSRCRKRSGGAATAILLARGFAWASGQALVRTWSCSSGYGTATCTVCGSPLPDEGPPGVMVVPAGLLDGNPEIPVADHSYAGSKACWDTIADDAPRYEGDGPKRLLAYDPDAS